MPIRMLVVDRVVKQVTHDMIAYQCRCLWCNNKQSLLPVMQDLWRIAIVTNMPKTDE